MKRNPANLRAPRAAGPNHAGELFHFLISRTLNGLALRTWASCNQSTGTTVGCDDALPLLTEKRNRTNVLIDHRGFHERGKLGRILHQNAEPAASRKARCQ